MTYMCLNDHRHTFIIGQICNRCPELLHCFQIICAHLQYHGHDTIISLSRDFTSAAKKSLIYSCEGEYSHNLLPRFKEHITSCPVSRSEDKNFELFSIQRVAMLKSLNCISMSEVKGKKEKCFFFLGNVGFPFDHQAKI
jgi:hypothetical protein